MRYDSFKSTRKYGSIFKLNDGKMISLKELIIYNVLQLTRYLYPMVKKVVLPHFGLLILLWLCNLLPLGRINCYRSLWNLHVINIKVLPDRTYSKWLDRFVSLYPLTYIFLYTYERENHWYRRKKINVECRSGTLCNGTSSDKFNISKFHFTRPHILHLM